MFNVLNESNFSLYAAKYYDNPSCVGEEEFLEDISRFKYLKRLFGKYKESGEIRERLILNHLIILYNVFPPEQCTRMLCMKLHEYIEYLKPFLVYLNYWPERIKPITQRPEGIIGTDIGLDKKIVDVLRKL